jgi:hypothetical protein
MLKPVTKISLPVALEKLMKQWRAGMIGIPPDYIEFHHSLAKERLLDLTIEYGIRIIESKMKDAGWMDGMMELNVLVEDPKERLHKLVWCDSNQDFMVKLSSGGQASTHYNELFG